VAALGSTQTQWNRSAMFSDDRRYRYCLRRWSHSGNPRSLAIVMLNPSTADDKVDDPTTSRMLRFCERDGFNDYTAVNLFALVSPHPRDLRRAPDPVGPDNDRWVRTCTAQYDVVVVAWGTNGELMGRARCILETLTRELWCFGQTQDGHPKFPLYIPSGTPLERFRSPYGA
jgi:hypothetical protein